MMKEMQEQPAAVADTIHPRVCGEEIVIEELKMSDEEIRKVKKLHIAACGSAYHAGVAGKYILEGMADIPVEVDLASEFRYRDPILEEDTMVMVISQSGETADALAAQYLLAMKFAKVRGRLSEMQQKQMIADLYQLPVLIEELLNHKNRIQKFANQTGFSPDPLQLFRCSCSVTILQWEKAAMWTNREIWQNP